MIIGQMNAVLITVALLLSCVAGVYMGQFYNRTRKQSGVNTSTDPADGKLATSIAASTESDTDEMNQLAYIDHLTQLPNRGALMHHLQSTINRCDRNGSSLALAFIDVDNFKQINDTHGHKVGDEVLKKISKRLVSAVRGCDKVARIGGDEFIAIIEDVDHDQDCIAIVDRMVTSVREPCSIANTELHLSVSIGIAIYPNSGDIEALIQSADKAMYRAKKDGKNQYRFFDEEIALAAEQLLEMQFDIKNALANEEFVLHYQIKIDSITRTPVGAEAFLRWQHPTRGLLTPADFMESAERVGLSFAIHHWVNTECCRTLQQLKDLHIPFHIAINLSHQQMANPNLVIDICDLLKQYDLPTSSVVFEVTESAATKNKSLFNAQLERFKAANIKIALDDFGTQASSIVNLQSMQVSELKFDPTFTAEITTNHKIRSVIQAMIELAHVLGLNVVAENIETEEQRLALAELGCDHMQGYLFSRPLPEQRLIGLLKNLNLQLEASEKEFIKKIKPARSKGTK
jgi:diguanylate cyclase (GGDEF)-like protein